MSPPAEPVPPVLEEARRDLTRRIGAGKPPGRWEARAVLVPLGEWLARDAQGALLWIGELEALLAPVAGAWRRAVEEELALACAEHVQAVDPRYLGLADYDLAYTLAARERLGARLDAADALGIEVPGTLRAQVERADRLLEPHVQDRGGA